MTRIFRAVPVLLPLGLAVAACGSKADDPPPYTSGVSGDTQLTNLTPAERTQICSTQTAFVRARVDTTSLTRFWCAFTPAVLTAPSEAACATALDACVRTFSLQLDVTVTDPNAPPQCIVADLGTCSGSVTDYEGCVNALAAVQVSIGTDFACGKRSDLPDSPTVGVAACNAVGPTCSGVTGAPRIR
jgi:hypothetical protein